MTQHGTSKQQALEKALKSVRNHQRLSTLKLWQLHLQSLSTPKTKPLLTRYHEDYEVTEMHIVSETTIISSDDQQTRVKYIEDDDYLPMFDSDELNTDEQ